MGSGSTIGARRPRHPRHDPRRAAAPRTTPRRSPRRGSSSRATTRSRCSASASRSRRSAAPTRRAPRRRSASCSASSTTSGSRRSASPARRVAAAAPTRRSSASSPEPRDRATSCTVSARVPALRRPDAVSGVPSSGWRTPGVPHGVEVGRAARRQPNAVSSSAPNRSDRRRAAPGPVPGPAARARARRCQSEPNVPTPDEQTGPRRSSSRVVIPRIVDGVPRGRRVSDRLRRLMDRAAS